MVVRAGRRLEPGGVERGGVLGRDALLRRGHRVHTALVDVHPVEQHLTRAGLVALRMPGGKETLIAPPDVQTIPVHGVMGRGRGHLGEHGGAHATAGQNEVGTSACGLDVDEACHQPCRDGLGEHLLVAVDQHSRGAHDFFPFGFACGVALPGVSSAGAASDASKPLANRSTASW